MIQTTTSSLSTPSTKEDIIHSASLMLYQLDNNQPLDKSKSYGMTSLQVSLLPVMIMYMSSPLMYLSIVVITHLPSLKLEQLTTMVFSLIMSYLFQEVPAHLISYQMEDLNHLTLDLNSKFQTQLPIGLGHSMLPTHLSTTLK